MFRRVDRLRGGWSFVWRRVGLRLRGGGLEDGVGKRRGLGGVGYVGRDWESQSRGGRWFIEQGGVDHGGEAAQSQRLLFVRRLRGGVGKRRVFGVQVLPMRGC